MLATCSLPFHGDSGKITDGNKGNFLSLIELLSKYDTVLEELIQKPKGTVNYLSPTIQNEMISLMADEVLSEITEELKSAPFFSIIIDTTQDVSKVDQLSEVFRYVKIENDQSGKPCKLNICETFTSFTAVTDQPSSGLEHLIIKSISEKGLDITKCRGQGYDSASVMSGVYSGVQKRIQELAPHAYFIHCASHNLNLVLKDAVDCNQEIAQFFETVQNVYNFFGPSIVWWQELTVFSDCRENQTAAKGMLKTLNPIHWAGKYEAVYALKERFCDVMKALNKIILTSKKSSEKNEAEALRKTLESFSFVLLLTIQCKILGEINNASKSLQSESVDLMTAYGLLGEALLKVTELRWSFEEVVSEAEKVCSKWGITHEFIDQRAQKVKEHFDALYEDQRLTDPKSKFRVTVFYPMVDSIVSQLDNRFKGMKEVIDAYRIVQPSFLASSTDEELRCEADKFSNRFSDDVTPLFKAQILSVRNAFKSKLTQFTDVKEVVNLLLIENSSLASAYPDVLTACLMYLTVPVTVAKAERSFSKLKLIKNYLQSSMSQHCLSSLALLSIENDRAQRIDFNRVIDIFASVKSRRKSLKQQV
ncbi:zinc finger MYM-type protein 1-like isoform X2 [Sceloporus undulatus]|nr:zinc finger MYM-type protein 1-like isoform X2 [Sceloporus undulatus]